MFFSGLPPGRLHEAFIEAAAMKRRAFFVNFIQAPVVLVGLLSVAFGIDYIIAFCDPFYLPPSVVTTLVVFAFLLLLSALSPKEEVDIDGEPSPRRRYVEPVLAVIEKPCDLILKHMAVCFTPSFILIPSGQTIAPTQIGLLTAYFIVSFLVVFAVSISIHRLAGLLPFFREKVAALDVEAVAESPKRKYRNRTTVAVVSTRPSGTTTPSNAFAASRLSFANTITPEMERELEARDWPRRESDATLVNNFHPADEKAKGGETDADEDGDLGLARPTSALERRPSTPVPNAALVERAPTPFPNADDEETAVQDQAKQRLAEELSTLMDIFLYAAVFLVALPIFYTTRVSVPLFLALNIAVYLLVLRLISAKYKKFFHPIIVTAFVTFWLVWGFGASVGWTLQETLAQYSTPVDYIEIWTAKPGTALAPGAGDLLVDGLDAGIIALALPLYRFRHDLRHYFFRLLVLIVPSAVLSIFVWPLGAIAFKLDPATALAFVGRFSSTPLAVAQVERIGGDAQICVVIVVVTGIVFCILQPVLLRALRIPPDDFLAIGLLSGVTSGAIGASGLLNSGKERAAAIASLSFALFGVIILVAVGIPPVAAYVQRLIGLP